MPTLEWKKEYSVGNDLIDGQHRGLLSLIIRLEKALAAEDNRGVELDVLTELVRYANNHFTTEEELMQKAGFPGRWEHEKSHLEFREDLARLAGGIMQEQEKGWPELLEFAYAWWQDHILGSDREAFLFFHEYQKKRAYSGS